MQIIIRAPLGLYNDPNETSALKRRKKKTNTIIFDNRIGMVSTVGNPILFSFSFSCETVTVGHVGPDDYCMICFPLLPYKMINIWHKSFISLWQDTNNSLILYSYPCTHLCSIIFYHLWRRNASRLPPVFIRWRPSTQYARRITKPAQVYRRHTSYKYKYCTFHSRHTSRIWLNWLLKNRLLSV